MRWPWQRDHGSGSASVTGGSSAARPPAPMGWAFLPPLQRTLAGIEPITRPQEFPHELPAWRNPSYTAPELTHAVSPDAPSGIIDGDGGRATGSPVMRQPVAVELALLPPARPSVQRAVRRRGAALTSAPETPGLPVVHRSAVADEPAPPTVEADSALDGGSVAEPPDHQEPPSPAVAESPIVSRSMDAPSDSAEPMAGPATGLATSARPPDLALTRTPPGPPSVEPSQKVRPATSAQLPAVQRSGPSHSVPPTPVTSPTLRPRLSLGPPMASPPPTAVDAPLEEHPDPGPLPGQVAPPEEPASVQAAHTEPVAPEAPPAPEETAISVDSPLWGTPPATLMPATEAPTPIDGPEPGTAGASSVRPAAPTADFPIVSRSVAKPPYDAAASPPSAPAPVQRNLAEHTAPSPTPAPLPPGPPPVPMRPPAIAEDGVGTATNVAPFTVPEVPEAPSTGSFDLPVVARSTALTDTIGATPLISAAAPTAPRPILSRGGSVAPGTLPAAVPVQRQSTTPTTPTIAAARPPVTPRARPAETVGLPVPGSAAATSSPALVPLEAATDQPAVQLTLARGAEPAPTQAGPTSGGQVDDSLFATGFAALQRTVTIDEVTTPAPPGPAQSSEPGPSNGATDTATPAGSASAGPGAAGAGAPATPEQVEALAGKLWPSVLRRIRAELLVDRERIGLRTDTW